MNASLKLLILGAHPDDAEYHAGGLAAIYRRHGHAVRMVSVTNGEKGHHVHWGEVLADRRRSEAHAAGAVIGAEYDVWEYPDGELLPTLDLRARIIAEIRRSQPDLVLTHRPNDYHPDHRAVGLAVQDACYLVTVPGVVPEVPILRRDPVVGYLPDRFSKPTRLQADVVIDVTAEMDTIVEMLACHASQFFEWLPFNMRREHELPSDAAGRTAWLRTWYQGMIRPCADTYRTELVATYGAVPGQQIEFCEPFEISEYAAPLDDLNRERLFWFLPQRRQP
jgi:LmbE family N-acetylglucosaminyl deacetylase